MEKITVEFTPQQAEALVQLLDQAVRAGGIKSAQAALPLVGLVMQAAKKEKE